MEPTVSYTINPGLCTRIPGTGGVQIFRLETVGQNWMTSSIQLMAPLFLRNSLNIPVITLTWVGRSMWRTTQISRPEHSWAPSPLFNYSKRNCLFCSDLWLRGSISSEAIKSDPLSQALCKGPSLIKEFCSQTFLSLWQGELRHENYFLLTAMVN